MPWKSPRPCSGARTPGLRIKVKSPHLGRRIERRRWAIPAEWGGGGPFDVHLTQGRWPELCQKKKKSGFLGFRSMGSWQAVEAAMFQLDLKSRKVLDQYGGIEAILWPYWYCRAVMIDSLHRSVPRCPLRRTDASMQPLQLGR